MAAPALQRFSKGNREDGLTSQALTALVAMQRPRLLCLAITVLNIVPARLNTRKGRSPAVAKLSVCRFRDRWNHFALVILIIPEMNGTGERRRLHPVSIVDVLSKIND